MTSQEAVEKYADYFFGYETKKVDIKDTENSQGVVVFYSDDETAAINFAISLAESGVKRFCPIFRGNKAATGVELGWADVLACMGCLGRVE
jgi:hypothetical protein